MSGRYLEFDLTRQWRALFLSCVLIAPALDITHAQNLVSNPGFESGADDWFSLSSSSFSVTDGAYSGTTCALVTLNSGFAPGIGQSLPDKLQAGQSYTWSAWLRVSPAVPPPPRSIMLNLRYTSLGTNYVMPVVLATLSTFWTQVSASFDLRAAGAVTNVILSFDGFSATPGFSFYLDEVSIANSSPTLSIEHSNNSVILSWPATAGAYSLQSKPNLGSPAWTSVSNLVETNGNILSVTLSPTNAIRFYRLKK